MTEEEFSELSAKVLTNEATEEEKKLLKRVCSEDPTLAETFDLIKASAGLLENYGPLVDAMDAKEEKIPDSLLEELMADKKSKKTRSRLISFFVPLAAAAAVAFVLFRAQVSNEQEKPPLAKKAPVVPNEIVFSDFNDENLLALAEFGKWREGTTRGEGNEQNSSLGELKVIQFENKSQWEDWYGDKSSRYKAWIDEDDGSLKILLSKSGEIQSVELDPTESPDLFHVRKTLLGFLKQLAREDIKGESASDNEDFPQKGIIHKVKKGDTLQSIAKKYRSKVKWIIDANLIAEPYELIVGKDLFIPKE